MIMKIRLARGGHLGWCAAVAALALGLAPPAGATDVPSTHLPEHVTPEVVRGIHRGLQYLATSQRSDGSWLNHGGHGSYPVVMTSLGGMALMAGGSTPESGPYAKEVRKAMAFVLRAAESNRDNIIALPNSHTMYAHGFGMLFLATCYGTELNSEYEKRIENVLTKAIALTAKAQSRGSGPNPGGGWYYTAGGNNDEGSVTVTQLQAIRACRNVGIKVPASVINRAVKYLKHCQQADGGICYSASSRGSSRPAISAAGIACFYSAGLYDRAAGGKDGPEARMVEKLLAYVKKHVSVGHGGGYSGYFFYTHLYMSQAMYVQGGADWKNYYPAMSKRLLDLQGGDGSWNGDNIGNTYGTAIACIILQLPYGYVPFVQR
jgi:hypothetical protein